MPTAEENARGVVRKAKGKAGEDNGKPKHGRLATAFHNPEAADGLSWEEVDPRYVMWLLVQVQRLGGAVTLGRSRDGNALMIAVLLDGERETHWISPRDDVASKISYICEALETLL